MSKGDGVSESDNSNSLALSQQSELARADDEAQAAASLRQRLEDEQVTSRTQAEAVTDLLAEASGSVASLVERLEVHAGEIRRRLDQQPYSAIGLPHSFGLGLVQVLREAASRLAEGTRPAQAWQPIESAPKDGTVILLWDAEFTGVRVARWHSTLPYVNLAEGGYWQSAHSYHGVKATHWMPLPAPPGPVAQE